MTITDLQKKIAEVLGVSASEKELAFDIFILKLCEIISDEITLKVQRIGFFQLKKGFSKTSAEAVLFIPLSEELYRDSKNLFLTIPIPSHHKIDESSDADVFSIGVGKPILPLSDNNSQNTETSYAILRKSIEERIGEILSEADQMPNFNIWEDYYKSIKYIERENDSDALSLLTADLDFKEEFMAEDLTKNLLELSSEIEKSEISEENNGLQQISASDLLDDYTFTEEPKTEEHVEDELISFDDDEINSADSDLEQNLIAIIEQTQNQSETENRGQFNEVVSDGVDLQSDENPSDELIQAIDENLSSDVEIINENPAHDENSGVESGKHKSEFDEVENIINDLAASVEDELEVDLVTEENIEPEKKFSDDDEIVIEIKRESKIDEVNLKDSGDEIEPLYYLGLKRKDGEPIEWDWGDELKEEFGVEFLKDEDRKREKPVTKNLHEEINKEPLDEIFRTTKPVKYTLFEEFDSTIKKEIESEEPHQVLEYSGSPTKYQFVEEQPLNYFTKTNYNMTNENPNGNGNKNQNGFSFGKTFLIIFVSFIAVASLIAYFLLSDKDEPEQANTAAKTQTESYSLEQPDSETAIDTGVVLEDDFNDFPRVATLEVNKNQTQNIAADKIIQPVQQPAVSSSKSSGSEFSRALETDTRVGKTIYFDGKTYNYQASSWRNKAKAEQEVKRLRALGLNAFLTEAFLPQKGGTWYRVRIGEFKTKEEAEQQSLKNNF